MKLINYFDKQSKPYIAVLGFTLIPVIGIADFLTGNELAFSVFYVIPIALITWFTNRRLGIAASAFSAIIWILADLAAGYSYSSFLIPIWNTLIRLTFFILITLLLFGLRNATEREKELARVDYLTGAANTRLLYELTQMEIDRFERYGHPFTLAYLDLDDFKKLNDKFGHTIGDLVLRKLVNAARRNLRKADIVARLGGDEFALLLPETNQESALVVLSRIQRNLLEEMMRGSWPITFSIGAITCSSAPQSADELVKMADELMYSVKREGKNGIKYSNFAGRH
jgi:diguanylate cyclase (GGDEF)-like protein